VKPVAGDREIGSRREAAETKLFSRGSDVQIIAISQEPINLSFAREICSTFAAQRRPLKVSAAPKGRRPLKTPNH
jgi:Mg-chelatase subunit ChlD